MMSPGGLYKGSVGCEPPPVMWLADDKWKRVVDVYYTVTLFATSIFPQDYTQNNDIVNVRNIPLRAYYYPRVF